MAIFMAMRLDENLWKKRKDREESNLRMGEIFIGGRF